MNCFQTLGVARDVWIDPDLLKAKFLALSAERHPDKASTPEQKQSAEREFAELNQGYNTLRNTRSRILHLLELAGIPKAGSIQNVPAAALKFFASVAEMTKRADELLKEKRAATSPMVKVQVFEKALSIAESIRELKQKIAEQVRITESELQNLSSSGKVQIPLASPTIDALQNAAATLGFLERWGAQLQEKVVALTF
jgi:DnaJ-domain-containing protein 1